MTQTGQFQTITLVNGAPESSHSTIIGGHSTCYDNSYPRLAIYLTYLSKAFNSEKPVHQHHIRSARKEDCATIATLYSIASAGLADYFWTKLAETEENILTVGRRCFESDNSVFSYRNCTVVECEGKVVGMVFAFPMHGHSSNEESDPVLDPYRKLREDNSYYICGMAVSPEYRGHGIGTRLLALVEDHARDKEFEKVSLMVFEQNAGAKQLYERMGYREVSRATVYPHPLIHFTGDAILMVKEIENQA
jgi:ribosomal protein S18 acetylase RimI-like enzyme